MEHTCDTYLSLYTFHWIVAIVLIVCSFIQTVETEAQVGKIIGSGLHD